MKTPLIKNHGFWIVLVVLFLAIIGSVFSFFRWNESQYFGKVTNVSTGSFTIEDKRVGTRSFILSDKTYVGKGKTRLDAPSVGDEVFIVGEKNKDGQIEALGVRVVDQKFRKKK